MTDEEYGKRYTDLVRLYRANPGAFQEDDLDNIEYLAKTLGRRFNRNLTASNESLGNQIGDMLGQFGSGLISGFTTIPIGDEPEDVGEAIARSIGQLAGFLGFVPGLGMATKAGLTASAHVISKVAGVTAATKGARAAVKVRQVGRKIGGIQPGPLMGKSIPMMVGSKAVDYARKYMPPGAKNKALEYLSKETFAKVADAGESALQLGVASAVSSWTGGVDQMIKGGLIGAAEGGVFRGITNFTQLGDMLAKGGVSAKQANVAIRTISSSLYGGLQSKTFGDPIELQIYHYLLGAFFGFTDVPYSQRKAIEFINKVRTSNPDTAQDPLYLRLLDPESNEGFKDLDSETQDQVRDQMRMMFGKPGDAQEIAARAVAETISDDEKKYLMHRFAINELEKNLAKEGITYEEAERLTLEAVKDKRWGDLISEESFYNYSKDEVNTFYDPTSGSNRLNESILKNSFEDHEIPTILQHPLLRWSESVQDKFDNVTTNKIALDIGRSIKKGIDEKRSFDEIMDNLGYEYNFGEQTSSSLGLLRKAYIKLSQNKPVRKFVYNPDNSSLIESDGTLSDLKRIQESKAESNLDQIAKKNNLTTFVVKDLDNGKRKTGEIWKHFFEEEAVNERTGETYTRRGELNLNRVAKYLEESMKNNRPFVIGKKDASAPYHFDGLLFDDTTDAWKNLFREKVDAINKIDPTQKVSYDNPQSILDAEIDRKYRYNNLLLLEEFNGLPIERIVEANKQARDSGQPEPFIVNAEKLNKRGQLFVDGNPILNSSVGVTKNIIVSGKKAEGFIQEMNINPTVSDGIYILEASTFDKYNKEVGGDNSVGALKFGISGEQGDGRGQFIGKLAGYKGSGKIQEFLKQNKLQGVFIDTAVKQRGLRNINTWKYDNGRLTTTDPLDVFEIRPETIKTNLEVYEKPLSEFKDARILKQLITFIDSPEAIERITQVVTDPSINGSDEINKRFANKEISKEELLKLNIDDLSLENISKVLYQKDNKNYVHGSDEYNKIWSDLLKIRNEDDEIIDPSEVKGEGGEVNPALEAVGVSEYNSPVDRKLKVAARLGQITPALIESPDVRPYAYKILQNYIFNRAIRPKVKNSGSLISYGNDIANQLDSGFYVKPGEFMLAQGMKNFKIKWIDGKEIPLYKAWDLYKKETDSGVKSKMEDKLEWIFDRAPQDSPSGARVLKFIGFSERPGYGVHLHDNDMTYMGGADNDIDKFHFYQSLDGDLPGTPVKDFIRSYKDQWSDGKGGVTDAKAKVQLFESENTLANGLDPVERFSTHLYATSGNRLVGPAATSANTAIAFRSLFNQGFLNSNIISLKRDFPGTIKATNEQIKIQAIEIGKIKDPRGFNEKRREVLNVAVDATNKLPYNTNTIGNILSRELVDFNSLMVVDDRGRRFPVQQLSNPIEAFNRININNIEPVSKLKVINDTSAGSEYNTKGKKVSIDFDTTIERLTDFDKEFGNADLGNAFFKAIQQAAKQVVPNYRKITDYSFKENNQRVQPSDLMRYARLNTSRLINVVNKAFSDKDASYLSVLSPSGLDAFSIGKGRSDDFTTYSDAEMLSRGINQLVSIENNRNSSLEVLAKGGTENDLKNIRLAIDQYKHMRYKFTQKDKEDPYYIRRMVLNDPVLNLPKIKNLDQLNQKTEEFRNKLTDEQKKFFDDYMVGSISEQRVSIDRIAQLEYLVTSNRAGNYEEAAKQAATGRYDNITYEYISTKKFKELNPDLAKLDNDVDIIYQNKTGGNQGMGVSFISDDAIARHITAYNDFIQAKPEDKRRPDGSDPRSSALIERLLLKNISKEEADAFKKELDMEFRDHRFRGQEQFDEAPSTIKYFDKHNMSKLPQNESEARQSSISDEAIAADYTNEFIERIVSQPKDIDMFDPTTEYGQRNQTLLNELTDALSKYPSHIADNFNQIYENYIRKEVGVSNASDIEAFIRQMNSFHKKTFLEDFIGADVKKGVSPLYDFFMTETIGRRMGSVDAKLSPTKVIQVLTTDGYKSKEVSDVMSTFEQIRTLYTYLEENKSATVSEIERKINESYSYLNDQSLVLDRDIIHDIAVVIHEMPEAINIARKINAINPQKLPIDKFDEGTAKRLIALNRSLEMYRRKYDAIAGSYAKLRDKKYTVYDENQQKVQVTGKDLFGEAEFVDLVDVTKAQNIQLKRGRISRTIEENNRFFYDAFINPLEGELFLVRNEDGSLNLQNTIAKMIAQQYGTKAESERIPNIGLSAMQELAREFSYLNNVRVTVAGKKTLIKDIQDPQLRDEYLFKVRMADRGEEIAEGVYRRNPNGTYYLKPMIGKMDATSYFAHLNHSDTAISEHIDFYYGAKSVDALTNQEAYSIKKWHTRGKLNDSGLSQDFIEELYSTKDIDFKKTKALPELTFQKYGNLAGRTERVLGDWGTSISDYKQYARSLNSAYHRLYGAIIGQHYNNEFRNSQVMGKHTESWAKFTDMYIQDFIGRPSSFPDEYFSDPYLNYKKRPYYLLSDQAAQKYYNRVAKKFGWKTYDSESELETLEFRAKLQNFTKLEAKAQLMTLLSNTTSMMNNYTGGNIMTAISSGFRPWRQAGDWKWLRDNIDPSITSAEKAREIAVRLGATEQLVSSDVAPADQLKASGKKFMQEIIELHKQGNFTRKQAAEIFKRNGFVDAMTGPSAWMLSSVEVRLRTRAFWAHLIQARETMMADGMAFKWDDPTIVQQALKGVWGSQFLYNTPNRPAIARTNLGRIFSRFQLWSWNSVKFRRDVFNNAREAGFQEGTPEYQRFVRMAQADAFVFALAAVLPMSLFENVTPSPWNYLQDFTDYFFGDEKEREKAFFGEIPYPFNPIKMVLPPSSRFITTPIAVPIDMAIAMLSDKDLSDALDYRVTSLIPYGNLTRNVVRSINNPSMAPQFLTGVPLHGIGRLSKKLEESATYEKLGLYEAKSRYVDEEIQELLNYFKNIEE